MTLPSLIVLIMGRASLVGRAGHPRLLPNRPEAATDGLAYGAPCTTIDRAFALSLIPFSSPLRIREYPFPPW